MKMFAQACVISGHVQRKYVTINYLKEEFKKLGKKIPLLIGAKSSTAST